MNLEVNPAGAGATVPMPTAADGAPPSRGRAGLTVARPPVALALLMLIALYAAPAYFLMKPVLDADVWWHLRTGQWVVENKTLPPTDPFSAYGRDQPYVAYSWLFDVLLYASYQALGLSGILALRLVLAAVVLIAIHRFVVRREPRFLQATALTALAFFALSGMLYERPWLFTLLFTLLTLQVVFRLRDGPGPRAVWLLPVAYALWANLHIQFVYGLALLGLACAAPFLDVVLKRPTSGQWADTPHTRAWRQLVVLTAACAAATLVNPYHVRLYAVVLNYASQTVPFLVVHELSAPTFRAAPDWAFLALALAGAFAFGRRQPRPSLFELLLFIGAAIAAFRARRDTWLVVFVSLAVCTPGPLSALRAAPQFVLSWRRIAVIASAAAVSFACVGWQRNLSERGLTDAVAQQYPVAAVSEIRKAGYAGPLFNTFDWGGYLIWALPEYRVSMDGRTNVHGDDRLARHFNTIRGLRWDEDPELMKTARLIIVPQSGPLPALLRSNSRFRPVYGEDGEDGHKDSVAAVFIVVEEAARP